MENYNINFCTDIAHPNGCLRVQYFSQIKNKKIDVKITLNKITREQGEVLMRQRVKKLLER